jgi:signal transduction histidine kinase
MPSRPRTLLANFVNAAIPWAVALFVILVVLDEGRQDATSAEVLAGILSAIVQGVALRWRRSQPERVMLTVLLSGLVLQLLFPTIVIPFAGLFAVGSLAAARPPRVSLVGLAGLLALSATNFFTTTDEDAWFTIVLAVVAWALGEALRSRRVAVEEGYRRALGEEQARMARELHDVIAHSVSVIVVQASAADDVFDEHPDQARDALRSIDRAGRDALRELRLLLSQVRPGENGRPSGPQPGLDRLDDLAEPLRAGGLDVVIRREGRPSELPAGLDLSAYRIVQEALTNTLRHARATRAEVTLRYGPDLLEVDVSDDGRMSPVNGEIVAGHGLVGMRERAALLGGSLEAGPLPEGGYRVHARLPVEMPA